MVKGAITINSNEELKGLDKKRVYDLIKGAVLRWMERFRKFPDRIAFGETTENKMVIILTSEEMQDVSYITLVDFGKAVDEKAVSKWFDEIAAPIHQKIGDRVAHTLAIDADRLKLPLKLDKFPVGDMNVLDMCSVAVAKAWKDFADYGKDIHTCPKIDIKLNALMDTTSNIITTSRCFALTNGTDCYDLIIINDDWTEGEIARFQAQLIEMQITAMESFFEVFGGKR